jgi:formamidopyrimidine-DNA glycosylase
MPELPDITIYIESLTPRILGQPLLKVEITSPFLLRSVDPPLNSVEGRTVLELRRIGKRIVWGFGEELYLVLHLMIAGRLHWKAPSAKLSGKAGLAAFRFPSGTLTLTEAGSKKRASLYIVRGSQSLAEHDRGGVDVLSAGLKAFARTIRQENHTLKRALTDPRLFSGIGNAYSDEILHAARLSPLALTHRLRDDEIVRLLEATKRTLGEWTEKLRAEAAGGFPEKVTAFRQGMAVHGRFGQPCPVCGSAVQRIIYAENETNYCPRCQTGGKLLADRSMSRLLKDDWPRTLEELEEQRAAAKTSDLK